MKRHYLITFCITFIFALIIRLIFFFQISSHPISKLDIVFTGSDMHGNLNWATEILNGDILGQDTYHPYHKWMKEIANENTWHKWWGGKQIFQQVPLYPYFLAVLLRITKHNIEIMRLIQLFIGSLTAGIIALISYFLFGKREGLFSGIIAALYFPFLCYEFFFLRDFLAVHFLCWVILILCLTHQYKHTIYFFLTGIFTGLLILTRENFLILTFFIWFLLPNTKYSNKPIIRNSFWTLIGIFMILYPLFFRNYLVGAPFFSFSNRLLESLIEGNAVDSNPVFMTLPVSFKKYFFNGEGNFYKTLILIINDHKSFPDFIFFQLKKIFFLFYYLEPFNNINLYFIKDKLAWIKLLPDYAGLFLFGYLGLGFIFNNKSKRFFVLFFIISFISLIIAPVLSRYRLILVPFLIICTSFLFTKIQNILSFKHTKFLTCIFILFIVILGFTLNITLPANLIKRNLENHYEDKIRRQLEFPLPGSNQKQPGYEF